MTKSQIEILENILIEAMIKKNIPLMDELLHDDIHFILPNGQTVTKDIELSNFKSDAIKIQNINIIKTDAKHFENIAISSTLNFIEGSYLNESINGIYKYLRVWKLFGESWKVIAGSGIKIKNNEL